MSKLPEREKVKLASGGTATIKYFDMDKTCKACGYTVFAAQKRWKVTEDGKAAEYYHYDCYKPSVKG